MEASDGGGRRPRATAASIGPRSSARAPVWWHLVSADVVGGAALRGLIGETQQQPRQAADVLLDPPDVDLVGAVEAPAPTRMPRRFQLGRKRSDRSRRRDSSSRAKPAPHSWHRTAAVLGHARTETPGPPTPPDDVSTAPHDATPYGLARRGPSLLDTSSVPLF